MTTTLNGPTATVNGGFWAQYGVNYQALNGKNSDRRRIAQRISHKGTYFLREVVRTLDGAVAGTTATKALKRVANSAELGGVRTIETETLGNRATTAGDVTATKADLFSLSARTYTGSPVANGDGNPLGYR